MADENEPDREPGGQEPSGQTDWKAEARKWQRRAQENFEKARAYDDDQEKQKSELQRAQDEAAAWKKQVDDLNAKAELDAARAKVARETGVPAELIAGDDEDSMREFAEAVAKKKSQIPLRVCSQDCLPSGAKHNYKIARMRVVSSHAGCVLLADAGSI